MFKVLSASRMGDVVIGRVVEVWEKGNLAGEIRYEVASHCSQGSTGGWGRHSCARGQSLNFKKRSSSVDTIASYSSVSSV